MPTRTEHCRLSGATYTRGLRALIVCTAKGLVYHLNSVFASGHGFVIGSGSLALMSNRMRSDVPQQAIVSVCNVGADHDGDPCGIVPLFGLAYLSGCEGISRLGYEEKGHLDD